MRKPGVMRILILIVFLVGMCQGTSNEVAPCWTPDIDDSLDNAMTRAFELYGLTRDLCVVPPESIMVHVGKPETVDSTSYLVYKDGSRLDSIAMLVLTYGGTQYRFGSMFGTWALYSVVVTGGSFSAFQTGMCEDCLHVPRFMFEVHSDSFESVRMYSRDNIEMLLEFRHGKLSRIETIWIWTWFDACRTKPRWEYDIVEAVKRWLLEP